MQTEMFFYLFLFAKKFSIYYYLINMKRFLFLLSLIAAVTTGVTTGVATGGGGGGGAGLGAGAGA